MSSSVRLICPNLKCRAILSVPQIARGKTVRCRSCGMRIAVPGGTSSASMPASATPSDGNAAAKKS
ncbi:MAG: hypothetical protein AAGF84_01330 [Planctomycetota bacterium]